MIQKFKPKSDNEACVISVNDKLGSEYGQLNQERQHSYSSMPKRYEAILIAIPYVNQLYGS